MQVLHVNRALPRTIEMDGRKVRTGIYKEPVSGPVHVSKLGLEGDGQADHRYHGGEYQAVYAYPAEHYGYWESELNVASFAPGTFGENLTISGLLETEVCVGDIHRIGKLVLQVTSTRLPCSKLGNKLKRPDILKPFLRSGRSGFYLRVLEEGPVSAGSEIEVIEREPSKISVRELLGMQRLGEGTRESIEALLKIEALAPLARQDLETRLGKI
jgi:MOSC domain-containing protein YiiM